MRSNSIINRTYSSINKLFIVLAPVLLIVTNIFYYGTATIYRGNTAEFGVNYFDLLTIYILPIIIAISMLTILGIILPKRYLRIYVAILFTTGILLWIQGNFLVWDYGVLDGREIEWSKFSWRGWVDISLWGSLLLLGVVSFKKVNRISSLTSTIIIILQFLLVFMNYIRAPETFSTNFAVRKDVPAQLFQYSSSRNIIHILFDGFQTEVFEEIINENNLVEDFDGFSLFRENLTASGSTLLAVGSIFGGDVYSPDLAYETYYKRAISEKGFQNILFDNGYLVNLIPAIEMPAEKYTTYYRVPKAYGGSYRDNVISEAAMLLDLSLFRHLPHILKKEIYNEQLWTVQSLVRRKESLGFFHQLNFFKDYIEKIDTIVTAPAYHFMHIIMPHPPFVADENCDCVTRRVSQNRANYKIQAKCTVDVFLQFVKKLKKLGIYDSSLIIVQADHGIEFGVKMNEKSKKEEEYLNSNSHSIIGRSLALLAVKPPGKRGAMEISSAATSTIDIAPTVAEFAGIKQEFHGNSVFEIEGEEGRKRKHGEYIVSGNPYNYNSWEKAPKHAGFKGIKADRYKWGTTIDFTFLGNAHPYKKKGWSHPEEKHCWTVGKTATLSIPISRPNSFISLHAVFRTHLAPGRGLDEQRVNVLVDGQEVAQWKITDWNFQEKVINIPKTVLSDRDKIQLTFELPDAASPEQLGTSKDPRQLGIGLRTLVLNEVETYKWGTPIDFTSQGNAQIYQVAGWGHPEKSLCWSVKNTATLAIPITNPSSSVLLKAQLLPFLVQGKLEKQSVDVLINYNKIGEWVITKKAFQNHTIILPKSLFTDHNYLVITFKISNPTSPARLGISDDSRRLGIGLRTLVLTKAKS